MHGGRVYGQGIRRCWDCMYFYLYLHDRKTYNTRQIHKYIHIYIYIYIINTCIYIYIINTYTHTYIYIYIYISSRCLYINVCTCKRNIRKHAHAHTHTHTLTIIVLIWLSLQSEISSIVSVHLPFLGGIRNIAVKLHLIRNQTVTPIDSFGLRFPTHYQPPRQ